MPWETKKFMWLALWWYSVYCSALEPKLHCLQGVPVFFQIPYSVEPPLQPPLLSHFSHSAVFTLKKMNKHSAKNSDGGLEKILKGLEKQDISQTNPKRARSFQHILPSKDNISPCFKRTLKQEKKNKKVSSFLKVSESQRNRTLCFIWLQPN